MTCGKSPITVKLLQKWELSIFQPNSPKLAGCHGNQKDILEKLTNNPFQWLLYYCFRHSENEFWSYHKISWMKYWVSISDDWPQLGAFHSGHRFPEWTGILCKSMFIAWFWSFSASKLCFKHEFAFQMDEGVLIWHGCRKWQIQ